MTIGAAIAVRFPHFAQQTMSVSICQGGEMEMNEELEQLQEICERTHKAMVFLVDTGLKVAEDFQAWSARQVEHEPNYVRLVLSAKRIGKCGEAFEAVWIRSQSLEPFSWSPTNGPWAARKFCVREETNGTNIQNLQGNCPPSFRLRVEATEKALTEIRTRLNVWRTVQRKLRHLYRIHNVAGSDLVPSVAVCLNGESVFRSDQLKRESPISADVGELQCDFG
jgi:predicted Zn-ribbon and HTH transcriptional regulator